MFFAKPCCGEVFLVESEVVMVSDSCKKRFGKIMLEQMELLEQVEIAPNIFFYAPKGQNGQPDAGWAVFTYSGTR